MATAAGRVELRDEMRGWRREGEMILTARYIVPVDGPAIADGAIAIEADRIAAVGPANEVAGRRVTNYGDAVICPGFVNAHTHLELSLSAGRVSPGPDFIDWLGRLMTLRTMDADSRETTQEAMRQGIALCLDAGVTTIGDITSSPAWTREVLSASPLRGVSFGEVIAIGGRRHLLTQRLEAAVGTEWQTDRLRIGISPHAPYTVEPDAARACADQARDENLPIAIHLAESPDEDRFTRVGDGPFADYLRHLGVWDASIPVSGCGPVELAEQTGALGPRTVIAHANYVTDADIERIAASGASVAYCPRTHHAFAHPPHRFRDMLAAGVNVCIGTDSLASNSSLSILDELRFLRQSHPNLPPERIMAMGTLHGARALGFENVVGSLTVGKKADVVVVPLTCDTSAHGWVGILDDTSSPAAVYVAAGPIAK